MEESGCEAPLLREPPEETYPVLSFSRLWLAVSICWFLTSISSLLPFEFFMFCPPGFLDCFLFCPSGLITAVLALAAGCFGIRGAWLYIHCYRNNLQPVDHCKVLGNAAKVACILSAVSAVPFVLINIFIIGANYVDDVAEWWMSWALILMHIIHSGLSGSFLFFTRNLKSAADLAFSEA